MKPILLFGHRGQIGSELERVFAAAGPLIAPGRAEVDLEKADALCSFIRSAHPALIVNAAAYTAVDRAEACADTAFRVNAEAPGVMAEEARRLGVPLIHYSTDYVFDGAKAEPYVESDTPHPLSAYGRSKLAGERAIAASGADAVIVRTSWVFGDGANFVRTILRLAAERESLRVVDDQIGAPTPAALVADVTAAIVATLNSEGWAAAIYHCTASGAVSWHGYARAIVAEALESGIALRLSPDNILPIPTADYPLPARRPLNSLLDCGRIEARFGLKLPHWRTGLERFIASEAAGLRRSAPG